MGIQHKMKVQVRKEKKTSLIKKSNILNNTATIIVQYSYVCHLTEVKRCN